MSEKRKRGIREKILSLCLLLVVGAISVSAIGAFVLLSMQMKMLRETQNTSSRIIEEKTVETMTEMTEDDMEKSSITLQYINDLTFTMLANDLDLLASQVRNVFEHPENYNECEVYGPKLENAGKNTLQVIYADEAAARDEYGNMMVRKLANLAPIMDELVGNGEDTMRDCLICLPNGTSIAYDKRSDNKLDKYGDVLPYDPRVRPWYTGAVESENFYIALALQSYYQSVPEIAYSLPVYVDGELVAVLEGTMELIYFQEFMDSVLDLYVGENSFVIIVSHEGELVFSSKEKGELSMYNGTAYSIENDEVFTVIDQFFEDTDNLVPVTVDGNVFQAYAVPSIWMDWWILSFAEDTEITRPTTQLLSDLNLAVDEIKGFYRDAHRQAEIIIILMLLLLTGITILVAIVFSGKLSKPIKLMTGRVRELIEEDFDFEMEDEYRTGDEIQILAESFENLSDQMKDHIREIIKISAEKEKVSAELGVATKIQTDMLPADFPLFPDRTEFKLHASMKPAREVGGDFYDAFMIDEDHLCAVLGDVSDKGVPAALFMVRSMTMIRDRVKMGGSPSEILRDVNNNLCENNKEMMFVTVWLGILTISTGELVETNAGHEYPALKRANGDYSLIERDHGMVMGLNPDNEYEDDSIIMGKGDIFFIYSDGLPDATNGSEERFETDRMLEALNGSGEDDPEKLLEHMSKTVNEYVGGADQFDDLTMLAFRYVG